MTQKEIEYRAWVTKMAFRCEYITDQNGRNPLTTKGWAYIRSGKFWRFISLILTTTNKRYRKYMFSLLTTIENEQNQFNFDEHTSKN